MHRNYVQDRSMGFAQATSLGSAINLPSIPPGAIMALITAEGSIVRWRDDGIDPTSSVGYPIFLNNELEYTGDLNRLRFIQASPTATLSVVYYGALQA